MWQSSDWNPVCLHSEILVPEPYSVLLSGYFPSRRYLQLPPKLHLMGYFHQAEKTFLRLNGQADGSQRAQGHRCRPLASATAVVSKGNKSCSRWSHLSLTGARTCIRTRGPHRERTAATSNGWASM